MLLRVGLALLVLILPATAHAIEGRYGIEGSNPGKSGAYRGEVIVRKTGATYTVAWQLEQVRQVGTGLLTGNVFSVVFVTLGGAGSGVASFEVENGKIRGGNWTMIGAQVQGTETWTER